jgi:hypothetical protein
MYLGSSSMPATGKSIDVQLIDIIRLGDDSFALEPAPAVHGLRLSDPMPSYRGRRAAGFC